ncbi:MAG: HAMP domain-containing protein [Chloroflexi bacterium]|nr:HAMP domain-containing protein [Chloroflexota bacterium]
MSKWNHLGLQTRIMAYATVGLLALFGGLGLLDAQSIRDTTDQVFRERMALARSLARDVEQDLDFLASDLRMGARGLNLPGKDLNRAADNLYQLLKLHAASQFFHVSFVGIKDEQGNLLAGVPEALREGSHPDPAEIQSAMAQNRPLILRSQRAPEGTTPFASVVAPLTPTTEGGRRLAVVADTVGVVGLPAAVPGWGTEYSMEIVTADDWTVITTSRSEQIGNKSSHYSVLQRYTGKGLGGVEVHRGPKGAPGTDHLVAMTPLPSGPFYVVLEQPASLALAVPQRRQNEMLAMSLAAMFLMLGAVWYTTRQVVRPVKQLQAAARAIAEGSLDKPVQVAAQDELGDLAKDIQTMQQQLKKSRDKIEQAKLELELKVEERTHRLQETVGKIITAQEEERRRLARELHDEQSQALGALAVSLERISRLLGPASPQVQAEMLQARDTARALLNETRRLIYDLRPSVLDDMGLEAAIRWCADTHLQRHGVQVTIQSSLPPARLPAPIEVALFRVAQEAIVNVERHSGAQHVGIVVEQQDSVLHMRVWDDGRGFVLPRTGPGKDMPGVGLEGMQERVRLVAGKMEVQSEPGKGTTIKVEAPLDYGGAT